MSTELILSIGFSIAVAATVFVLMRRVRDLILHTRDHLDALQQSMEEIETALQRTRDETSQIYTILAQRGLIDEQSADNARRRLMGKTPAAVRTKATGSGEHEMPDLTKLPPGAGSQSVH